MARSLSAYVEGQPTQHSVSVNLLVPGDLALLAALLIVSKRHHVAQDADPGVSVEVVARVQVVNKVHVKLRVKGFWEVVNLSHTYNTREELLFENFLKKSSFFLALDTGLHQLCHDRLPHLISLLLFPLGVLKAVEPFLELLSVFTGEDLKTVTLSKPSYKVHDPSSPHTLSNLCISLFCLSGYRLPVLRGIPVE